MGRRTWRGGWALAGEMEELAAELAGEDLRFDGVAEKKAALPDFADEERWRVLGELQARYEEILARDGLQDLHAARAAAVRERRCGTDKKIVLVATTDLNRLARLMLEQVAERVTALVHACRRSGRRGFDEFGCVKVEHWAEAAVDFPCGNAHGRRSADGPGDGGGGGDRGDGGGGERGRGDGGIGRRGDGCAGAADD